MTIGPTMTIASLSMIVVSRFGSVGRPTAETLPGNGHLAQAAAAWLMPLLVVLLGGGLLVWHWQCWRGACAADDGRDELDYQRRRFRRRMQTSGMLLLVGVAMACGQAISPQRHPSLFVSVWAGVALLAVWAMALAFADVLATRAHVSRLLRRQFAEQAKLQAELMRKKRKPPGESHRF